MRQHVPGKTIPIAARIMYRSDVINSFSEGLLSNYTAKNVWSFLRTNVQNAIAHACEYGRLVTSKMLSMYPAISMNLLFDTQLNTTVHKPHLKL